MPGTPLERFIFLAGLSALATIWAFLIPAWQRYGTNDGVRASTPSTPPSVASESVVTPPAPTPPRAVAPAGPPPPTSRPKRTAGRALANLAVTASGGDCWLLVRAQSQNGAILFQGTLSRGRTARFRRARPWLRLGAPNNLVVSLNGKRVTVPSGTSTIQVTPRRVQTLEIG